MVAGGVGIIRARVRRKSSERNVKYFDHFAKNSALRSASS